MQTVPSRPEGPLSRDVWHGPTLSYSMLLTYLLMPKRKTPETKPDTLRGWQQIAVLLGQPISGAQRWAADEMPVRKRGRYVESSREELNRWLDRESAGEPVQIATPQTDLSTELKRGLSFVRKQSRKNKAA